MVDIETTICKEQRIEELKHKHEKEINVLKTGSDIEKNELQKAENEVLALKADLAELKKLYDDLYHHSYYCDIELNHIKSSKSYKIYTRFLMKPIALAKRILKKIIRILQSIVTLNFKQLAIEITRPFEKAKLRIKAHREQKILYEQIQKTVQGKRVIVFPPTIDWHMKLFQRPQQLAVAYSKKDNTVVIYLTANAQQDSVGFAELISDSLWLVNINYLEDVLSICQNAQTVIMSMSWTINRQYLDRVKPHKLIYEYIDELEIFDRYDEKMKEDHNWLMKKADVTVCTATKLYNQAIGKATNPILSPNAGDYEFFSKTDDYEINPLIADKVKKYSCVLGYYGALASWFDYDVVKSAALRHPDWLFLLVGMDYDGTLGKSGINDIENIKYVPPQDYKQLPTFLKAFDIAIIPFVINEITLSTSPVKLFEYMAANKPILTSKMPECLKYKSVKIYETVEEFCDLAEHFNAMQADDPYWDDLKRDAAENTWDARTDQILSHIS